MARSSLEHAPVLFSSDEVRPHRAEKQVVSKWTRLWYSLHPAITIYTYNEVTYDGVTYNGFIRNDIIYDGVILYFECYISSA
jgi:hypothetical protein